MVSRPCYPGSPFCRALPAQCFFRPVPFSRFVVRCPPKVSVPSVSFSRFVLRCSPDAPVCPSRFPLRRALLVRHLFTSIPSLFLSRVALSALTVLPFFCQVLLCSTNHFAIWRFDRQTVTLGFSLTHLCCVCVCARFCYIIKLNFWFLFS